MGSGLAFGVLYSFPKEEKPPAIIEGPVAEKDIAAMVSENKVVIEEFYSPTCANCRAMEPVIEELVSEMGGRLIVVKIDVTKYPDLANAYGIRGVPTFIIN
ncbi:MAG: thioredoxin family protein, partial [Candidatus Micrarchaeota archaeon]|nr:thioredoxin family protein [Candidatus Micrarchaeota archaeon]